MSEDVIIENVFGRLWDKVRGKKEPQQSRNNGQLAAFVKKYSSQAIAVLYDRDAAINFEKARINAGGAVLPNTAKEYSHNIIKGMIGIRPPAQPCWGAWEVEHAAGPGQGKILYGIAYALSPNGRLMADRRKVSADARDAWKSVAEKGARKYMQFDDFENPKTPIKDDDCKVYKGMRGWGKSHLNAAYETEGWENAKLAELQRSHESMKNEAMYIEYDLGERIERNLALFKTLYWNRLYHGKE